MYVAKEQGNATAIGVSLLFINNTPYVEYCLWQNSKRQLSAISCLDYPTPPTQSSRYGHHTRRLNELIWLPRTPSTCPFWLVIITAIILLNQRIMLGSHTTPHTPQSHAIGENNRRIVRNKASIYIVPNRTNAYDLHICAGQRCSHVLLVQST